MSKQEQKLLFNKGEINFYINLKLTESVKFHPKQVCGVLPEEYFDCYYKDDFYADQEVLRWILIIAAIAIAVGIHIATSFG